jgi:hydrogenase maturation protease
MNPLLIIGIGNRLREDDGMGCRAAELLARPFSSAAAEIEECHQLTPEWAARLANARIVIFLDAATDQEPGSIVSRRVQAEPCKRSFSHHLSPGELLDLAATVHGSAPVAFLISGGAFQTGLTDRMTPDGERCAQQMAAAAERILAAELCSKM